MLLKILFALLGMVLGGCIGLFGVFYLCMFIDYLNPPKPGSGAGSVGWVFTFITIPLFAIIGCASGVKLASIIKNNGSEMDRSKFVVIPYDANVSGVFENGNPTNLNKKDLLLLDEILTLALDQYNSRQIKKFNEVDELNPEYNLSLHNFTIQIEDYKRQYVPIINKNDELEVWVNCFYGKWSKVNRTEIIQVDDGGNLYFNLKINLTQERYFDFIVNSES